MIIGEVGRLLTVGPWDPSRHGISFVMQRQWLVGWYLFTVGEPEVERLPECGLVASGLPINREQSCSTTKLDDFATVTLSNEVTPRQATPSSSLVFWNDATGP